MEPSRSGGWVGRLLWVAALLVCAASLPRLAEVAASRLSAPFDLGYETHNLRPIQLLQAGRPIYDASTYAQRPWWITPYTPLYHQLVALLPPHPANPFLPGRLVAMACMLLAAGTLFVPGGRAVPLSLLAFALFFAAEPIVSGTPYLKNDSLALLLSALAVVLVAHGRERRLPLVAAAVLAALALATKQSYGAALVACTLWLAVTAPRRAVLFAGVAGGVLGALTLLVWSDGFRFSVIEALRNPMSWDVFAWQVHQARRPVMAAFAVIGLWALVRLLLGRGRGFFATPYPSYAVVSAVVMLGTLPKVGSALNYVYEPALALLLWIVWWSRAAFDSANAPARRRAALLVAVLVVAAGGGVLLRRALANDLAVDSPSLRAAKLARLATMAEEIRRSCGNDPLLLNLYDGGFSHPMPGTLCVNDVMLYKLLWESGRLDPASLIEAIQRRDFDAVLTPPGPIEARRGYYPDAMIDALSAHYAPGFEHERLTILLRRPVGG